MSDKISTLLASPTFQGIAGVLIGFSCLGLALVKGFDVSTRLFLGATGVSAIQFGVTKLGIVSTQKAVKKIEAAQEVTHSMIAANTEVTLEAASQAQTAAEKADVAAQEAAQSRRMP